MNTFTPLFLVALLASSAALAQAGDPQPGSLTVTPPGFELPAGGDCQAEIARYRAIQANDLAMGHVAQSVYNQIKRRSPPPNANAAPAATPRRAR